MFPWSKFPPSSSLSLRRSFAHFPPARTQSERAARTQKSARGVSSPKRVDKHAADGTDDAVKQRRGRF